MRLVWRLSISLGFVVLFAACQPIDESVEGADVEVVVTAAPATTEPDVPEPTTLPSAPQNVEPATAADTGVNNTGDIERITRPEVWQAAVTGGRRVTVTFVGNEPGNFDSLCNWDYGVDVQETASDVTITLRSTKIVAPGAHRRRDCQTPLVPWAITTTLAEPLGSRSLIDPFSGGRRGIQIETRLTPTWLPDGWTTFVYDKTLPQQTSTYGEAGDDGAPVIEVLTTPITLGQRLSTLRLQPGWESIQVRRPDDGVFVVDASRVTTVGFEEQGWFYLITADPSVDPSTVLQIARSFERPALVEPGTLPASLTQPQSVVPLQPGQDEGEARPLQGVLPAS